MNQNIMRMNQDSSKEYALPFAAWELRLYLDTHPNDERALAAFRQICAAAPKGACNYACAVFDNESGMGCGCSDNGKNRRVDDKGWRWIDDPWPWEIEANVMGGCK